MICVCVGAFKDCTEIAEVKISENVERIGVNAFYGCTELSNVEISETIMFIDNEAFDYSTETYEYHIAREYEDYWSMDI